MYVPEAFKIDDGAALDLIERHPFGILVTCQDGAEAVHVPFLLDRQARILRAHVARANGAWRVLEDAPVLCVFNGPHAYVSPDWYAGDQGVPTWNYIAVHVTGTAHLLTGEATRQLIEALSEAHEQPLAPKVPWRLEKLADKRLQQLERGIVGFEVRITGVTGKAKLSQNRSTEDRRGVIEALRMRGGAEDLKIADLMAATLDA